MARRSIKYRMLRIAECIGVNYSTLSDGRVMILLLGSHRSSVIGYKPWTNFINDIQGNPDHCISKKYFRPGGMAPSEWTRFLRAVRDTPVGDYSAPGINSMRRVPYRPLIAVSPFLLVLSVSYSKRSLWRCG